MKFLSWILALAGVAVIILGLYGRFHNAPDITFHGQKFAASTFLLVANTMLLISIILGLHGRKS